MILEFVSYSLISNFALYINKYCVKYYYYNDSFHNYILRLYYFSQSNLIMVWYICNISDCKFRSQNRTSYMRHKIRVHVTSSTKKKISQIDESLNSSTLIGEDDCFYNENDDVQLHKTPEYCQDILSSTHNQQQESIRYQIFQMNINQLIKPNINHRNNTVL